jgi:hypothetical protein
MTQDVLIDSIPLWVDPEEMRRIERVAWLESLPDTATLSPHLVAEWLDVQPQTLNKWRHNKRYSLPYTKVGQRIRYRAGDVKSLLEQLRRN